MREPLSKTDLENLTLKILPAGLTTRAVTEIYALRTQVTGLKKERDDAVSVAQRWKTELEALVYLRAQIAAMENDQDRVAALEKQWADILVQPEYANTLFDAAFWKRRYLLLEIHYGATASKLAALVKERDEDEKRRIKE